jgi:hypothetical protein
MSAGDVVEETVNRSEATSDGIVAARGDAAAEEATLPTETVTFVEPDWAKPPPPHPQSRIADANRMRTAGALRFMEIPPSIAIA